MKNVRQADMREYPPHFSPSPLLTGSGWKRPWLEKWSGGSVCVCVCVCACMGMVYTCMCVHVCARMCVLYSSCSSDFGVSVTLPGPLFMLFPRRYLPRSLCLHPRALLALCLLPALSSWNRFPRAPALPTRSTPCSSFRLGPVGVKWKERHLGIVEPAAR